MANCKGEGVYVGNLTNCRVKNVTSSTNNGKIQTVRVADPQHVHVPGVIVRRCWWRVTINFPAPGDRRDDVDRPHRREPVRLIE